MSARQNICIFISIKLKQFASICNIHYIHMIYLCNDKAILWVLITHLPTVSQNTVIMEGWPVDHPLHFHGIIKDVELPAIKRVTSKP